jgi:hypothetical protein
MTQTKTDTCPSTTALSDEMAVFTLTAAGIDPESYKGWHGRKMCADPLCHGAVLRTRTGIRKHVVGSNLTADERFKLTTGAKS